MCSPLDTDSFKSEMLVDNAYFKVETKSLKISPCILEAHSISSFSFLFKSWYLALLCLKPYMTYSSSLISLHLHIFPHLTRYKSWVLFGHLKLILFPKYSCISTAFHLVSLWIVLDQIHLYFCDIIEVLQASTLKFVNHSLTVS